MAFPSSMTIGGSSDIPSGITVAMHGGDPEFRIELQADETTSTSAGDSTSTGFVVVQIFDPGQGTRVLYQHATPLDTIRRYFRSRHVGVGYDDGPFTAIVSATPAVMPSLGASVEQEGRRRVDTMRLSDGTLKPSVQQNDGSLTLNVVKGFESDNAAGGALSTGSTWVDGADVSFVQGNFQDTPSVQMFLTAGTITNEPKAAAWSSSSSFTSTARQFAEMVAVDVSADGFAPRARLVQRSTSLTNRTAQFTTGNQSTAVNQATTATLGTNAPSYNDQYTLHYDVVDITLDNPGTSGVITLKLSMESDTTGGYIERAVATHAATLNSTNGSTNYTNQAKAITVVGASSSDTVRLKVKSFTVEGTATTNDVSFTVHGYTGTTGSKDGVTFQTVGGTPIFAPMCPTTNDTVHWQAFAHGAAT